MKIANSSDLKELKNCDFYFDSNFLHPIFLQDKPVRTNSKELLKAITIYD